MDAADQKLIAEFEELTRSLEDLLRTLATDLGSENFESSETKETSFIDLINFSTLPSDQKKVCHRARKLRNFYAHKNGNKLAVPDGSLVRSCDSWLSGSPIFPPWQRSTGELSLSGSLRSHTLEKQYQNSFTVISINYQSCATQRQSDISQQPLSLSQCTTGLILAAQLSKRQLLRAWSGTGTRSAIP